ncbi:MAG: nascent polypeptide-associated complex protein [Candidatus ainarchaeum sp.]|jgi:nascent polypeptide-associated complex subunit alpha|nr:nascent polypeptide-associated complex protein [Candidatus ainarchaeum sp.]MDD3086325.1 nascent polypeptide-associated complex protein [Candidatus ainarchaeum sp.]MDD4128333.1 nascent polypeptide-associated complex protein [Candidatus ainarchaeum sp.]MDD4468157.1 nascent polypeptide-associated complex protein [Candidatus ainarchaeum sp.]HPM86068.1 nascent polypeptide-associated complex protein [archaeon]
MFPGGMNPRQMSGMMKQFGIKNQEVDAEEVIIKLKSGKVIKIVEPQVQLIEMKGVKTYSLAGREVIEEEYSKEDVSMVAEQAGVSEEEAKKALIETKGDIAQAILKLKE